MQMAMGGGALIAAELRPEIVKYKCMELFTEHMTPEHGSSVPPMMVIRKMSCSGCFYV